MTRTVDRLAADDAPRFRVRQERDPRAIESLLSDDRGYAVFALGHLEPDVVSHARFWVAEDDAGRTAMVMHASGMLGRTTIVVGDPTALSAALSLHPGPRSTYLATGAPEHLTILQSAYTVTAPLTMMRMTVTASDFKMEEGDARLLRGLDARALNGLYATGGGPTGYRAGHIDQGVYYGAFENGRLVAVAGTHLVAPHVGVAVVGNVYTHPSYRGRGLATQVTSAVTARLFDRGCPLVALTVAPENESALHAYAQLGYRRGPAIVEAKLRRRSIFGLGPLARRWLARRNGGVTRAKAGAPDS